MHPKGRIRAPPNANASQRLAKRGRARARLYGPVRARMRPCGPVRARERLKQGRGQVSPLNGSGVQDRFSHIRIKLGTGAVQENSGPNALAMAKPTSGTPTKSAYVGWTSARVPAAAAVERSSAPDGRRTWAKKSASSPGTSTCRETVAGNASDVNEPPCPAAIPVSEICATTTATPAQAERKSALPAS